MCTTHALTAPLPSSPSLPTSSPPTPSPALGHGASFSCYFHSPASPACERRAFREASSARAVLEREGAAASLEKLEHLLSSDESTVMLPSHDRWLQWAAADIAW